MKKLTVWLLALLIALLAALPVSADQPVTTEYEYGHDYMLTDCGDFELWSYDAFEARETQFFDQGGTLVKGLYQYSGTDSFYKSTNPGVIVATSDYGFTVHWSLVSSDPWVEQSQASGILWNVVIPGQGSIYHRAGQQLGTITYVDDEPLYTLVKETGLINLDEEEFCAALR